MKTDVDFAALVRGEDRFGHFRLSPPPTQAMDVDAVATHELASAATHEILYQGAEQNTAKL